MHADVDELVTSVVREIEARLPELTTAMTDWFVEVIPEFRRDETLRRLMVASTSANLVAIVDMLVHSIPMDRITVPPAAAEYARRFAQHDLSLEALLRAYRLGEQMFAQRALDVIRTGPHRGSPVALDAVSVLSERTNRYIDQVIAGLIDIYEAERRRWTTRAGAGLATRVRMVLDTDPLADAAASELLGVPVTGRHTAAVVWTSAPGDGRTLQVGARLLYEASGRPPLTVLADSRTLWAWLSGPDDVPLDTALLQDRLPPDLRIAVGGSAPGIDGFRGSLAEAQRARAVAETAEDRPAVVRFDDVAVAALLTGRSDDLRRWVDRVLAGLTAGESGTDQLRETLRVFLATGGSYTQAAARLHLHKNTVHYRVRRAEELMGRKVGDDRLHVEVALLVASQLRGRL